MRSNRKTSVIFKLAEKINFNYCLISVIVSQRSTTKCYVEILIQISRKINQIKMSTVQTAIWT